MSEGTRSRSSVTSLETQGTPKRNNDEIDEAHFSKKQRAAVTPRGFQGLKRNHDDGENDALQLKTSQAETKALGPGIVSPSPTGIKRPAKRGRPRRIPPPVVPKCDTPVLQSSEDTGSGDSEVAVPEVTSERSVQCRLYDPVEDREVAVRPGEVDDEVMELSEKPTASDEGANQPPRKRTKRDSPPDVDQSPEPSVPSSMAAKRGASQRSCKEPAALAEHDHVALELMLEFLIVCFLMWFFKYR